MNNIIIPGNISPKKPQLGDIYINKNKNNNAYILACPGGWWRAINLATGQNHKEGMGTEEAAVEGLTFLGRDMKITLEHQ